MTSGQKNSFLKGTRQKVIAGFIVASISIAMASGITYYSFNELLLTVDRLAEPNIKLDALNNFFRHITSLDQQLRATALTNPKLATSTFLQESKELFASLDTLEVLPWSDSIQYKRLQLMRSVLQKRNRLFLRYLQSKLSISQNTKTSAQLDSLSHFLITYSPEADTSIVTTNKKTITIRHIPNVEVEKEKGFLSRLFEKKKKKEIHNSLQEIQEESSTTVDTVSMRKETKAIEDIGFIVKNLEEDKRLQNRIMLQREVRFIDENTRLLNELLAILRNVEQEELKWIEENYVLASSLANKSKRLISVVILIFLFCSLFLIILILVDITRTRYYRHQLIEAKEKAENLGELKQQFLSNMSHEIRTPLQSIIGFSELAGQQYPESGAIASIQKSSEHLLHIVNEVLDFTQIESGKFKFSREPFLLTDVLDDVFQSTEIQAKTKGLLLTMECSKVKNIYVLGDAFRLRQILFNLIGNAVKFTNTGFIKLHVDVVETTERWLECTFTIQDSGIGIAEDDQLKIFNEFEQANNIQIQHGGSGIGLSIVKNLVEAQSGTIQVKSKLGEGATFIVHLRFDKVHSDTLPPEKSTGNRISSFNGKVLIVDDDEMILRFCGAVLQKKSIHYSLYKKSKELVNQIPDAEVTHMLIDIRMPEIRGTELISILKRKWPPSIRFVAITAHALPAQQEELLANGFDAVLLKPFRESDLLNQLSPTSSAAKGNQNHEIDIASLLKLSFGDTESVTEIIQSFIEETEEDIEQLSISIEQSNQATVREIVHRLAGRTGQLGSVKLSKKLRIIETAIDNGGNLSALKDDLIEVREDVVRIIEQAKKMNTKTT